MRAKKSVVNSFFINMIVVILIIISIFAYFMISNEYERFDKQYQKYKSEFIESKKSMIKNDVNVVVSNIYHRKCQLEGADNTKINAVKKDILKWTGKIRLRENQYIVVNTFDGIILSHYKTKNIGKNMWNFTDKNGVKAVQETIKVSKNKDGGYVSYIGSIRPSTGKPGNKITYAKSIPDWGWVVLTGVYLDDIEIVAKQKQKELNENLRGFLLKIVFIIVVAILISFFITRHTAIKLKANFAAFNSFFSKAAISSIKIDSKKLFYSEFENMALSVNQMSAERNQAEQSLRESEVRLRHQQKLEAIGTLAGGVAHEINNPIYGIMNYARLISERLDQDSPLREFSDGIGYEAERVADIVRNLLAFARQEKESHSPAKIADIVNHTISLIRTIIRRDQIALEVDVPEGLPLIKCRSQQIQQVLMNLLTNARDALNERYTAHDPDKIIAVTVKPFERDGRRWLRTTVKDHGPGIPNEIRERLFDPFFTTKDRTMGTGLGLSISQSIVQDHHGKLSFTCEPDQYTCFYLDLPVDNGWSLSETSDE